MPKTQSKRDAGFAFVELLLVLIIVFLLTGVGYWVFMQGQKSAQTAQTANEEPVVAARVQQLDAKLLGTIEGEEAIDQYDIKDETTTETQSVSTVNSSVTTAVEAAKAIGDSYNEATF